MTAQLHCFGESGHSYKVALMMQLTGYPWQPVFVDFFGGATRSPDYRALNEMAEAEEGSRPSSWCNFSDGLRA